MSGVWGGDMQSLAGRPEPAAHPQAWGYVWLTVLSRERRHPRSVCVFGYSPMQADRSRPTRDRCGDTVCGLHAVGDGLLLHHVRLLLLHLVPGESVQFVMERGWRKRNQSQRVCQRGEKERPQSSVSERGERETRGWCLEKDMSERPETSVSGVRGLHREVRL